jgi:hypothetical protein
MKPLCLLALAVGMAIFGIRVFYSTIRSHRRDIRLIRAATEGAMPRDGEVSAAVGTIHALRDQIDAPFSKRRCVIFEYNMHTQRMAWIPDRSNDDEGMGGGREEPVSDVMCSGFQMAPCAVRTTKGDDVMLVGFPDLHGFTPETFHTDQAYVAAKNFVSKTFHNSTWAERTRAINTRDGIVEKHRQYVIHVDPTGQTLEETCVLIDEPVCVIGHFSQTENGFISDTTVYCGTPETLLSDISSGVRAIEWRLSRWLFGLGVVGIWLCSSM